MANAYTNTTAMAGTVQTAYDLAIRFPLRSQVMYRSLSDVRPVQQAHPGLTVRWSFYQDLTDSIGVAPTALTEDVDPDAVALSNVTNRDVTLAEYGNSTLATIKLYAGAFSAVDQANANILARDMAAKIDNLALATLRQGTNVVYSGGASTIDTTGPTSAVAAGDVFNSALVRYVVAKLRGGNVAPRMGQLYLGYVHPDMSHDLQAEVGNAAWRPPHEYSAAGNIWNGTIGVYGGAAFVETSRAYSATDGTTSRRVFRSLFVGQECLAEAVAIEPHTVVGPVVDKLRRHAPLGWFGLLGMARFREEAIWRVEAASSITAA